MQLGGLRTLTLGENTPGRASAGVTISQPRPMIELLDLPTEGGRGSVPKPNFWQIFCFVVSFTAILMLVVAEKDISYPPTKRYSEIAFLLAGPYTILRVSE